MAFPLGLQFLFCIVVFFFFYFLSSFHFFLSTFYFLLSFIIFSGFSQANGSLMETLLNEFSQPDESCLSLINPRGSSVSLSNCFLNLGKLLICAPLLGQLIPALNCSRV